MPETRLVAFDPPHPWTGRRAFLARLTRGSLVAASALAVGQLARFFAFQPVADAPATVPAGKPADYAAGTLSYAAAAWAYIGRDEQGLYAVDAVCTHLGCLVKERVGGGFACPCHGSQFGVDGKVQAGPATQALHHLSLQLDQDGQIVVDRGRPVASLTRLADPS